MGSAASSNGGVVVVHSANIQEDREALMAIFPDKFQVEKQQQPQQSQQPQLSSTVASSESSLLQWSDPDGMLLILVLLSCPYAKGTHSSVVLGDDEDVRQAAERATLFGVKGVVSGLALEGGHTNNSASGPVVVTLTLPGGATVWLTTSESWKSEEARNSTLTRFLRTPSEDIPVGGRLSLSPKGRKRRSANVPTTARNAANTTAAGEQDVTTVVGRPTTVSVTNPLFPSLRVQVLSHKNEMEPYQLNTEQGLPIETDWFVGSLLLVMRPVDPEQDPYWNEKVFSKKKRRVIMQLQGKLKYTPEGELYAGMEIADPMRLGLLASGLCSLLLKMSSKFNPQLHYSFGDENERAHISFPASTFFEEMVITPPGETPPPIGQGFEEDPVAAQQRKSYKTKVDWNTSDTYSMSFHSMYLDFPTWSVVRLPIGKDVGLQTFWGNSPASVVWYEVDSSTSSKKHVTSAIKYLVAVEMKNIGKDADESINSLMRPGDESDHDSEDQFVEVDFDSGSISTNGEGSLLPPLNDDDDDFDDQEFFDTVQSQSLLPPSLDVGLANISAASSHAAVMHLIDKCCPCVIDMPGQKGKYSHVFAFYNRQADSRPLYRSLDIAQELMGDRFLSEIDDGIFTPRLSPIEASRRSIGLRYAEALIGKASPSMMSQFQRLNTSHDKHFLQRVGIRKNDSSILSCMLARAVSDRHWIEEWACITNDEVLFYRLDHSKPHFRISLASIVKVEPLPKEEWPLMQGYHFLSIETFGRATCLMFKSAKQIDDWIETILDHRPKPQAVQSCNSFSSHLIDVDEPSSEFLRRSSMWDCSKRKLLNCRKFSFRTPGKTDPESTLSIAETVLRKAAALDPKGSTDSDLILFLDCASALKEADAHALNEEQRFAFFLNVYHIMIMHAYIVLGPPDSSLKWLTYFNTTSYQCADDIFSLSELEHNIIRAQMSFPSQFLSRFVVPKSHYQFALTKKDIRLSFALNCGSLSIPMSTVPVYLAEKLDDQLDNTTRSFLAEAVSIKPKGSRDASVVLPRICQWFADDFGDGSGADIVKAIEQYLAPEQKSCLQRLWNDRKQTYDLGLFNPKYSNYIFECRFLKLDQAKEAEC